MNKSYTTQIMSRRFWGVFLPNGYLRWLSFRKLKT